MVIKRQVNAAMQAVVIASFGKFKIQPGEKRSFLFPD